MSKRLSFAQWLEVWEVDDNGRRIQVNHDFTDLFSNYSDTDAQNDTQITVNKSITSNPDTASVTIQNHRILEKMYRDKYYFFEEFHKKNYEIDLLFFYNCGHLENQKQYAHCFYSGDFDDIYVKPDRSITDQSIEIRSTAGLRASIRTIVNKKYPAGTTYKTIVEDVFSHYFDYELTVLDDPKGKLNKALPRARTYHKKASDILNDIARDLEMTWGFDSNPWTVEMALLGQITNPGQRDKHAYFVDKCSVFDVTQLHGTAPFNINGSTGKDGRIGYTKSQFTFDHRYDHPLNIGMAVNVSDYGTMNEGTEFLGRVNRISVNNSSCHVEAAYIGDDGLAIVEYDKKHAGALVL